MKLTVKNVPGLKLKPGKEETIYFDDDVPGFGIRLREGGSRTWIFQYKIGAKHRRMALGKLSAIDVGKARDNAGKLYAKVRLGQDPAGEAARGKAHASETFGAIAQRFLADKRKELRPRSYTEVERHILVHAKPLHALQVGKITRADIAGCINTVRNNSSPSNGNRVRSSLSSFFSWAIEQGQG